MPKLTQYLANSNVPLLEWPAMSPDLSPIEQLWDYLGQCISCSQTNNFRHLENALSRSGILENSLSRSGMNDCLMTPQLKNTSPIGKWFTQMVKSKYTYI